MIKFLIKGLLRDKSRSRVPIIVVAVGVMLTVFMHAYITGFMGDTIEMNARFSHGHLNVMTRAYAENMSQLPNDLALMDVEEMLHGLNEKTPGVKWTPRIQFGGLVDAPDEFGETRSQGPAMGMGIDLLSGKSKEAERLNIEKSLVRGNMIQNSREVLLSEEFSKKLNVNPGEEITLIGSTMNGSMTMYNFNVAGTVSFGIEAMDRGTIIVDIEDAREALDMYDSAGELVGFLENGFYDNEKAIHLAQTFNAEYESNTDEYAPVMKALSQQGSMGQYVALAESWTIYISMVFVLAIGTCTVECRSAWRTQKIR